MVQYTPKYRMKFGLNVLHTSKYLEELCTTVSNPVTPLINERPYQIYVKTFRNRQLLCGFCFVLPTIRDAFCSVPEEERTFNDRPTFPNPKRNIQATGKKPKVQWR
jgi:hypothetical protein